MGERLLAMDDRGLYLESVQNSVCVLTHCDGDAIA